MNDTKCGSRARPSGYAFPPLEVSVDSDGSAAWIVEVRGELDLATGTLLKGHLEAYNAMRAEDVRPESIIYVLTELTFMDACGLHALLDALDGHGPDTITIREPSPRVRKLLELVDLAGMIEVSPQ